MRVYIFTSRKKIFRSNFAENVNSSQVKPIKKKKIMLYVPEECGLHRNNQKL